MEANELESLIKRCLDEFYRRRLQRLTSLQLKDALRKKNPYLFKAIGVQKASEIVEELLRAYMSSSDEGIFGDVFFEPIAKLCSGGTVSPTEGVDVAIETDTAYKAVSVKSGPNIFNASQAKRMNDEFQSLRSRMYKVQKQFDALLGHGYGRKTGEPTPKRIYRIRSGQAFWEELTGDPDFFIKLVTLMRDYPAGHRPVYQEEWGKAVNRFVLEFLQEFSAPDGGIEWVKLVEFNSGARRKKRDGTQREPRRSKGDSPSA